MEYSITEVTSAEDITKLLITLNKEKESLEYRLTGLNRSHNLMGSASSSLANDIQSVTSQMANYDTQIPNMLEGKLKDKAILERKKLDVKLEMLEQKFDNYDSIAKIQKEEDVNTVQSELTIKTTLIAALETRRTELSTSS